MTNNLFEVVYAVINNDGSITLKDKESEIIELFYYKDQESAIAKLAYLNPGLVIVFDFLNLLSPELVICLKKIFKRRVSFIEEEFPSFNNKNI